MPVAATAKREVPCAECCGKVRKRGDVMRGIMTKPPPIPAKLPSAPARAPMPKALGMAKGAVDSSFALVLATDLGLAMLAICYFLTLMCSPSIFLPSRLLLVGEATNVGISCKTLERE